MSGGRSTPFLAATVLVVLLAGCGGKANDGPASSSTSDMPSDSATSRPPTPTVTSDPLPEPPMNRIVAVGDAANMTETPRFTMPDQQPGAQWTRVEFAAEMPGGTWLFLYIPLPPGREGFSTEMPRTFRVAGGSSGAASGHIAFAPFLVQNDNEGLIPETFFQEQEAVYPDTGAWEFVPNSNEVVPFGDTNYAGIVVFAAATSDWDIKLTLEAPWKTEGNLTVGPELAAWGAGFQVQRLPAMTASGTGETESKLDWTGAFPEGWMAAHAQSSCYNPSPCAEAVTQEDWTITFPQTELTKEFHRSSTSGTSPCCHFGAMDVPAGDLRVVGALSGLSGARDIDVFFAPVPSETWPFEMTASQFAW